MTFASIAFVSVAAAISLLIVAYLARRGDVLRGKYIERKKSRRET
jgi:hypothetical protein